MEYRQLGRSGLKVSTITLGTQTFGGKDKFGKLGNIDVKEARRIIDYSIDQGVNLIDTANLYSKGLSEKIIGEALDGKRPQDVLIASKGRMPLSERPNDSGFSRHYLVRECEKSLKRLKTDHLDIYYMHQWDGLTPLEEMLSALDTLIKHGKIRYIACSNFSGWQTMKALAISKEFGYERFVAQQVHYTLESREAEYELFPTAIDQELGSLIWSPLADGLLSGKYTRDNPNVKGTRIDQGWPEPPINDYDKLWDIVDVVHEVADELDVAPAQVSLAWILTRPSVTSVVITGRNFEQIKEDIGAHEVKLPEESLKKLNEVSRIPLIYPFWHQAMYVQDRFSEADKAWLDNYTEKKD